MKKYLMLFVAIVAASVFSVGCNGGEDNGGNGGTAGDNGAAETTDNSGSAKKENGSDKK